MRAQFVSIPFGLCCLTLLIGGCTTAPSPRQSDNAALKKEVATEVARICGLPAPERQSEVERVKSASGMVVVCPDAQ